MNGTSAADRITSGTVPATYDGPNSNMEPAATIEVSGIQCALLGTGSTAGSGRTEPTSMKLHSTGVVNPWPVASCWAMSE